MKKGIKTVFKVIGKSLLIVLSFTVVLTCVAFIYNRIQCKKEESFWIDTPGQMVEVDGHKMHIYSEGEGDHTIVSMPLPTVPTIQYIAMQDSDPIWESGHQDLVDASENGKLIKLDCGHYVYWYEQDRIVRDIKEFLKML